MTRLTYTQVEAAEVLGLSRSTFRVHVLPTLKVVRLGRRTMIPASELGRWVSERAEEWA